MATNPYGLSVGSPIWVFGREDTPRVERIVSATSRSWVLRDGTKIPKAHPDPVFTVQPTFGAMQRYCLTKEAADEMFVVRQNWRMAERVRYSSDAAMLRKVASALGLPVSIDSESETA